jgi:tRNA isopentenyl-2-thiomethyl-A-37 hydroxylase MiaE
VLEVWITIPNLTDIQGKILEVRNLEKFNKIIDELDDTTLKHFYKKLSESGIYQSLLNVSEIDLTDINKLRETVKIGVQRADYEKLKEIGPQAIIKEIESINNNPVIVQDLPEPEEMETTETVQNREKVDKKEKLIQELIQIKSRTVPGIGIPAAYRDRYGEILTALNEKYAMTQLGIQELSLINPKTIAKAIAQYKEKHPIQRPDDKVVTKSESKVAEKLTAKVTSKADEIIESDMELAIHIREAYLHEAYLRGISLMELVDTAIPIWFNIDGIYNTMIEMERETLILKEYIKRLETANNSLSRRNVNLNRILITRNEIII